MRALNLFGRLIPWLRAPTAVLERDAAGEAPASFPAAAYKIVLDRLVETSVEAGAREERERIRAIMTAPEAQGLNVLAWYLVEKNMSAESAQATLRAAQADAAALAAAGEHMRLH